MHHIIAMSITALFFIVPQALFNEKHDYHDGIYKLRQLFPYFKEFFWYSVLRGYCNAVNIHIHTKKIKKIIV